MLCEFYFIKKNSASPDIYISNQHECLWSVDVPQVKLLIVIDQKFVNYYIFKN